MPDDPLSAAPVELLACPRVATESVAASLARYRLQLCHLFDASAAPQSHPDSSPSCPKSPALVSPGTRIPTRFSGSAADSVIVSPLNGRLRIARTDSTATGKANCSPRNPSTNRPPRISPRSSSRRNRHQQFAPRRQVRLPRQQIANHNSVAPQQHPARCLHCARPLRRRIRMQQRPPSRAVPRTRRFARFPARRAASDRSATADCRSHPQSPVRPPPVPTSAVSISAFNLPVPRTMSAKNEAPRCRRNSSTSCAP